MIRNTPIYVWLPALIFTSVLVLFLIAAFFLAPNMTPDQRNILLLSFALLAGFSAAFLGGTALLEISGSSSQGGKLGLSATAGVAVFMLCYLYPPYFFTKEFREGQSTVLPTVTSSNSVTNVSPKQVQDLLDELATSHSASDIEPLAERAKALLGSRFPLQTAKINEAQQLVSTSDVARALETQLRIVKDQR